MDETKHVTGVLYNVTGATDCQTREIELWRMVPRIPSREHLCKPRATELVSQDGRTTEPVAIIVKCISVEAKYNK
jgi:hypothetical protein